MIRLFLFILNQSLSSAIVIVAFSLFVYLLTNNLRSQVTLAFSALLACVCFAYAGDVTLFQVKSLPAAIPWLKFQWLGIAFMPAAYLHFSDEILRTTNDNNRLRRMAVIVGYAAGILSLVLALWSDLLVHDGFFYPGITQFRAGRFFWLFSIYFFATVLWGALNIQQARSRCLTSTSRRRMTYLAVSFAAPAAGVFPYMLVASVPVSILPPELILAILFLGNLVIASMIVTMAYSVAYFGVLTPDRVVKHNLVYFLLRGPMVATLVIAFILSLPRREIMMGLPREMIAITGIVLVIVMGELSISVTRPLIDRLLFHRDSEEIGWIRELDRRLLTSTDLKQALENILTALCEALRVQNGFIFNIVAQSGARIETYIGSMQFVNNALEAINAEELKANANGHNFVVHGGYWFLPLRTKDRDKIIGVLGVEASRADPALLPEEIPVVETLVKQAEIALEDQYLQQNVFGALRTIIPEIDQVQRLRGIVRYSGSPGLDTFAASPVNASDFNQMVRDALSHYWGGPKLTSSPLLRLKVVQDALDGNEGNAVRALRAVLDRAIDNLRPDGKRQLTAAEWVIYNILEMKFIQGMRVRDVAQRLAMSESDLYRKQRIAIQEVARSLAVMEQDNLPVGVGLRPVDDGIVM